MPQVELPSLFLNSEQQGRDIRTMNVELQRGLFFPSAERIYANITQAVIPYSFVNISTPVYKNACFHVNIIANALPTTSFTGDLHLPAGIYPSLTELSEAINALIRDALGLPATDTTIFVDITANTSTNQVIVEVFNPNGLYLGPEINFQCGTPPTSSLYTELGLPLGTTVAFGVTNPVVSSGPVLFNDRFAAGILIICEGDLNVMTYLQNVPNANVLAQVPLTNADSVGSVITYPRDLTVIQCPVIQGKTIRKFKIRFVSPLEPTTDLIFLQGNASVVILFKAVY